MNEIIKPTIIMSGSGKMATVVADTIGPREDMVLYPIALTGPNQPEEYVTPGGHDFKLIPPERHAEVLASLDHVKNPIIVDFTQPEAVNRNAALYCDYHLPFVMGTTGGNREALEKIVIDTGNIAVIAPNMAKQIVALQSFLELFAKIYQGTFKGYTLDIRESHQQGKKDTSGTARAMLRYFQRLGIPMDEKLIDAVDKFKMEKPADITLSLGYDSTFTMIREPETQLILGIPKEHLGGHGWHTYALSSPERCEMPLMDLKNGFKTFFASSPAFEGYDCETMSATSRDKTVFLAAESTEYTDLSVIHNISGRQVYADGVIDALRFLTERIRQGEKGRVCTMSDVLKGN